MARGQRDLGLERQWWDRMSQWRASGLSVRLVARPELAGSRSDKTLHRVRSVWINRSGGVDLIEF